MAEKAEDLSNFAGLLHRAIAAPSMKAALEAWGADSNLFHQGAAKQARSRRRRGDDGGAGCRLKRPVGSSGPFKEDAELSTDLAGDGKPTKTARKSAGRNLRSRPVDKAAERKAALAYEREQGRRERERAREEAARRKEHERRQQAVDKAQAALDKAEREHEKRAAAIQAQMEALEKKSKPKMPGGTRKGGGWKPS